MTVRICSPSDWRAMTRLRMARTTHAGASVSAFTSNPINTVHSRYQQSPHMAVGCWEQDKLVSYICAFVGTDYWVLDLMISSGDPKQLHNCLDFCLQEFESRNIKQFYYAFPQKWARAYRSFWKDGCPTLRKYAIEDLTVIEARKRPTDPFIWSNILHECVVPVPFLLRRSYVANT